MELKLYQVDAFTHQMFGGNPAAIVPLKEWLSDDLMQRIALENNLSETAFFVPEGDGYHLRWFTPAVEVDLCGHATLATAHVLFEHLGYSRDLIQFQSRSGILKVWKTDGYYHMDFPQDTLVEVDVKDAILQGVGIQPIETYRGKDDYLAVFESQSDLENFNLDFKAIGSLLQSRGLLTTAPGQGDVDFVSRCFFPNAGIDEDPVTGSAHTTMAPYWANRLEKSSLKAVQISNRQGHLGCRVKSNRVELIGQAVTYLHGTITL